jgi:hypothetical protein
MERHIAADVAEQRAVDLARLDKMVEAVWPPVTASLVTADEMAEDQVSAKVLLARLRHQHDAMDVCRECREHSASGWLRIGSR